MLTILLSVNRGVLILWLHLIMLIFWFEIGYEARAVFLVPDLRSRDEGKRFHLFSKISRAFACSHRSSPQLWFSIYSSWRHVLA